MRVPPKEIKAYPLPVRLLLRWQRKRYGVVLYPALLWGRVAPLFLALSFFYGVLERKRSRLTPALRSLVLVRVSQLNECRFCIDINSAHLARRAGITDKVCAVANWRESDVFDAREGCALEYAEAMTQSDLGVTDDLVERLKIFFDEETLVELTALIAFQNMSTKFNNALDVPAQGFCDVVKQQTRPAA